MPIPVFPGVLLRLPTERTPPRWIRRRINEHAHRVAMRAQIAYHQAVAKMLEEWKQKKLDARLIEFWEPNSPEGCLDARQ